MGRPPNEVVRKRLFGEGVEDFSQAEWLAEGMGREWRYDFTANRWHHWNGMRWAPDETNQAMNTVATLAAETLAQRPDSETLRKALIKLTSNSPIERALEALATFSGYGTNGDDWDSDPNILGVKNGIVDLRTNRLIAHPTPDMLVTKTTDVEFYPIEEGTPEEFTARAPEFMRVMRERMSGDEDMVYFLLFWFGASLFGISPEQRFLLMTGIGRNGKGALKHSIMKAVGEYGAQFDANLYMRNRFGSPSSASARADLLGLKGKRITFFSEPEGNRFNEEMLKAHTGGDTIAARALYSNNIQTWTPTHSITFLVNDAPEVEDIGPSMAARVMVADFRERYDGDREDKQLYGKLEREAAGVLAILVWAATIWHARWDGGHGGLILPERVVEKSREFMERGDGVANALNAVFAVEPNAKCTGQAAYDAYRDWHRDSGEQDDAMSMVRFTSSLEKKGFRRYRDMNSRGWLGLRPLGAVALAERDDDEDET